MSQSNMRKACAANNDEFYTQIKDIANELANYKLFFKDKVVLCNCDDPTWSNFWRYFHVNFEEFGLKKLIATHYEYDESKSSYYMIYEGGDDAGVCENGESENKITFCDKWGYLKGNGDFRSDECIELLKQADIVCTNPPFSLFREYIAQLMEYNKSFIVLSNMNAITYKEVFPLIRDNKVWAGYGFNLSMIYKTKYKNELASNRDYVIKHGYNPDDGYIKVPAICWFTNIQIKKRSEKLIETLTKSYYDLDGNPKVEVNEDGDPIVNEYGYPVNIYPDYENYDAIEVGYVKDIPYDYFGMMGVPITFLDKYNPDEFEIVDINPHFFSVVSKGLPKPDQLHITGKKDPYARLLIRRKYKDEAGTIKNV